MTKYQLGLIGIIRDRSHYVKEWLAFHRCAGVEAFYIILDGCREPTKDRILELPFQERIHLHETIRQGGDNRQIAAYDFLFQQYKDDCRWMIVVDSDEFLFNPQGIDLKEVLAEYDDVDCGGIAVPWTVFGPSDHVLQPPGLFIDNFVTSHGVRHRSWGTIKSITKTSDFLSCGHVHYMNVKRPYVLENGTPLKLTGRCEIGEFHSDKLRLNHYHAGSMEDWVNRSVNTGWGVSRCMQSFRGSLGKYTNRDACRYSKPIRTMLKQPAGDAVPENTVFLSTCDYEKADEISYNLRRTAGHFGVPLTWASYGEPFGSLIDTKVVKLIDALVWAKASGKKHAFVVDCRDVVFTDTVQNILDEYNLIYRDGVLFNADLLDKLWPFESNELLWRIRTVHGSHGIVNSGVYCGTIDAILALWDRLLNLRRQITEGRAEEFCTQVLFDDPAFRQDPLYRHYLKPDFSRRPDDRYDGSEYTDPASSVRGGLLDDDQFFVQVAQVDHRYPIRVDRYKQLLAAFDRQLPSLRQREEYEYDDARSIGTAKILHSPWLSRYETEWNRWIETEVLR